MATKPENPSPIFNLPIFIPENWSDITLTTTTSSSVVASSIIGEIIAYTGLSVPSANYLFCDGTGYISTLYSDLFALIGYTYGSSIVTNPSSSTTSAGNDIALSSNSVSKLIPSRTNTPTSTLLWTIVIPSNTGGGSFTINAPLYITNSGTLNPFGTPTLTISTLFVSLGTDYIVLKNGSPFATGAVTPPAGVVNPFSFQVASTSAANFTANSYIGNYSFSFYPDIQATTATYTISSSFSYTTTSSATGGTTSWSNTATPYLNSTISVFPTSSTTSGTITVTSTTATGYSAASVTWTGNTLFLVPNLTDRTPVGSDSISTLTTTYGGTPVTSSGNKTMSVNQLATHNHSVTYVVTGMLQALNQNNAIQGIGAGTFGLVKTALTGGATYTATAGNAGNSADLLPPFSVCNFIIRAH